jgi:predicted Zn-dependent protease
MKRTTQSSDSLSVSIGLVEKLLSRAMQRGGDFAEVFAERNQSTAVVLDEDNRASVRA